MQHRRTKWVWIGGFSSGVWKWECFRTVECQQVEFQVDGAATEKARRASSVCMRGTTSIGRAQSPRWCTGLILMSFQKPFRFLLNELMHAAFTSPATDSGSWFHFQASMYSMTLWKLIFPGVRSIILLLFVIVSFCYCCFCYLVQLLYLTAIRTPGRKHVNKLIYWLNTSETR